MATKPKTTTKTITERTWRALHAAFVAPRGNGAVSIEDPLTLRELARTFGVPFAEAERRAHLERWQLERDANESRAWLAGQGRGATTEAEFIERWGEGVYGHIIGDGPEGTRYVRAMARRIWIDHSTDIARWEAFVEETAADEAFGAHKDRMNRCEHCRQRAA